MDFRSSGGIAIEKARVYGARLQELAQQNQLLTPADVVEDGRRDASPLHDYFEWDDSAAAEAYRLVQARYLLRHLDIIVERSGQKEPTRAFQLVTVGEERGYMPAGTVFADVDLAQQVIERARRELAGWADRYRQYQALSSEMAGLLEAVQMVLEPAAG